MPAADTGAQSIELDWQNSGVYLCKDKDGEKCSVYTQSAPKLVDGFNNEVKYIRIKNPQKSEKLEGPTEEALGKTCQDKLGRIVPGSVRNEGDVFTGNCEYAEIFYGAILFEHEKFGESKQSECAVYRWTKEAGVDCASGPGGLCPVPLPYGYGISSVMVFVEGVEGRGEGITLYEDKDYGGKSYTTTEDSICLGDTPVGDNQVSSIKINGNYMAVLFGDTQGGSCSGDREPYSGACAVYAQSDSFTRDEPLGHDQASALKVIKTK